MILVLLLYTLFASIFTASKEALIHAKPLFLVGTRMMFAGAIMLIIQYVRKPETLRMGKPAWSKLLKLAFFNIYLTNVCEFWGLQYLTAFKTCFIYSLSPFVSALLSYLVFSEVLNKKKWLGLAIGFAGFIPILAVQTIQEESAGQLWIFSWAELAVIVAVFSSVYGWIILKQLVSTEKCSTLVANGFSMLIGGTVALCHSFAQETWDPIPITNFMPFFECTLFLIIISNGIGYNLYGHLLKRFSPTFMSFAGFAITPLVTALFGWIFHSEIATMSFYLSLGIVFVGLLIFYQEELKESARKAIISFPREESWKWFRTVQLKKSLAKLFAPTP